MKKLLLQFAAFLFVSISIGYAQTSKPVTKDEAATYQALSIFYFLPDDFGAELNKELIPKPENKVDRTAKLIEQAQNGNRVLQAILGFAYETGLDKKLSKNIDKAEYWYKKSAELGFEPSYNHLSELIYCRRPKTPKNTALVLEYMKKANNYPAAILTQSDIQIDRKGITVSEIHEIKNKLLKLKLDSKDAEYFWGMIADLQSAEVDTTLARIYNKLGDNENAEILLTSALNSKTLSLPTDVATGSSTIERYQYLVRALRTVQSKKQIPNPRQSFYCD